MSFIPVPVINEVLDQTEIPTDGGATLKVLKVSQSQYVIKRENIHARLELRGKIQDKGIEYSAIHHHDIVRDDYTNIGRAREAIAPSVQGLLHSAFPPKTSDIFVSLTEQLGLGASLEFSMEDDELIVGGHPKCTTFGHLKVHHFLDGKTVSD